jgi:hypothetical protein
MNFAEHIVPRHDLSTTMTISKLRIISSVFLLFLLAVASASQDKLVPTTSRALLRFFSNQFRAWIRNHRGETSEVATEPQPLLVINAGNGRTGTASFVRAMERLGLKCYHMKEGVFETLGHMNLWSQLLVDQAIDFEKVLDAVSKAGFNASADAPINFYYKEQMERYPNAPVILSIRPEDEEKAGDNWQSSLRERVFRFPPIMSSIPFRWMPGLKRFREFTLVVHNMMAGTPDGKSDEIDTSKLVKFYYDWIEDVKRHVPAEKLLIFKATDGWEPLCRHIAHVSPVVARNCRDVLKSGEPFPRVNDRSSVQRTQIAMRGITYLTYMLLGSVPVVGWLLLAWLKRRYQAKRKFD